MQPGAAASDASATKVEIVGSSRVEASDLMADGGSFRDRRDPFWQVVIDRNGLS